MSVTASRFPKACREPDLVKRLSLQQANAQLRSRLKAHAATVPRPKGIKGIASFNAYQDEAAPLDSQSPTTIRAPGSPAAHALLDFPHH
ncbi:hypothetical protein FUT89_23905 [Ralstonia pseudosolanacearum]|nr:hypothetical protein FUT89_23905 [Ralstonia pseudosolanacearum]